ncbi:MAG: nucleotidyltransferase domain-containing protein [Chloroflexi bacterium]|nr:nucleotidyltransferase domain-containing protein [Chloroflexota bacterium]
MLDAALKERRAANERERQLLLTRVLHLLDELAPQYGIRRAYIFGSVAMLGRFGPHSDVDIAVEQIDPARFFEAISKFSFYVKREVDLVELSKCHFADKIRREGVRWMQSG